METALTPRLPPAKLGSSRGSSRAVLEVPEIVLQPMAPAKGGECGSATLRHPGPPRPCVSFSGRRPSRRISSTGVADKWLSAGRMDGPKAIQKAMRKHLVSVDRRVSAEGAERGRDPRRTRCLVGLLVGGVAPSRDHLSIDRWFLSCCFASRRSKQFSNILSMVLMLLP